ncbi:MAG: amidohydrolase [Firmicutes bacterium]|nr:amidohydrolase [Bacillota bacterium]
MKYLDEISDYTSKVRRKLHQIPELGFNEFKTRDYLKKELENFEFEIHDVAKTGIVAVKRGLNKNAIAFRADMDALVIKEENDLSFKSRHEGKMHACGHDGHMAIVLGFAKYLSKIEKLNRDIVLIFQPAEEGPGGAEVIVNEGILEKFNIKEVFGLHILPDVKEGKVATIPGAMMAKTGEVDITIKGKGGHGAIPQSTIDTLYATSQLINNYQSIISRNINPIQGAVMSIGKIKGGQSRNIIAEKVEIEGIIRAFDTGVYELIKRRIKEINEGIKKMYGVKVFMEIRDMYPPVVNDKKLYDIFKSVIDEEKLEKLEPMMISEDFSYYQREIPGLFFMLGSRNEEKDFIYPLHNARFNFNEEILVEGVKIYIKICEAMEIFI